VAPSDALCHLAFSAPCRTRRERVARLWQEKKACSWQRFDACSAHITRVSPQLNAAQDSDSAPHSEEDLVWLWRRQGWRRVSFLSERARLGASPLRVQRHFRWPQRTLVLPRDQELMRLNLPEVAERRVLAPVGLRRAPQALTQAGPRLWSRLAGSHPATVQARRWRGFPSPGRGSSGAVSAGTPRRAAPSGSRS
jgi:hypothetical protein